MNNKVIDASHFRSYLFDGMTIMFGGFMGVGTPKLLVDEIIKSGVSDLTLIGNDTGFVDTGVGPLIVSGQVKTDYLTYWYEPGNRAPYARW